MRYVWVPSLLTASALMAAFLLPRQANADCCQPSATTTLNVGSSPDSVPTNALIRLDYTLGTNQSCIAGTDADLEDGYCRWVLRSDGTEVAGQWRVVPSELGHITVVFEPDGPYEPQTEYTVTDSSAHVWIEGLGNDGEVDCEDDSILGSLWEASFTTGDGPDTETPTVSGEAVVQCRSFTFERGAMCDVSPDETITAEGFEFSVEGVTADDPSLAGLRLEIQRPDGTPISDEHAGPLDFHREQGCECGGDQPETRLPDDDGDYVLVVYAEDIAGNRSETEITVNWSRTSCILEDDVGTGGCECSATGSSSGNLGVLLLALIVAFLVWSLPRSRSVSAV